jgi:hypothetical protein
LPLARIRYQAFVSWTGHGCGTVKSGCAADQGEFVTETGMRHTGIRERIA